MDNTQSLQEAQEELTGAQDRMTIWKLFAAASQSTADPLRSAAADAVVHVTCCGGRGGVHDQER